MKIKTKYFYHPYTGPEVHITISEEEDLDKIIEAIKKINEGVKS